VGLVNFAPTVRLMVWASQSRFCPGGIIIYSRVAYFSSWHCEASEVN